MKLSHSKLNMILTDPASYYLTYKQGIALRIEKDALEIGSATHWGIEHNTEDLTGYLKEEMTKYDTMQYDYGKEQAMAEAMVHGYLKVKDSLFDKLLTDYDGKTKLTKLDEYHELTVEAPLKSYAFKEDHSFLGIIDLLLLTEKGFIVVDYKTSSQTPDWDKYLDQLYRYIYLLGKQFPDTPVYKIAIINLKKTGIRLKQNENMDNFIMRLKREYEINDDKLIDYHEFDRKDINEDVLNGYIDNLSKMADFAQDIENNQRWFINFNNANSVYGKSQFWDIFYRTPDCEALYKIKDPLIDPETNTVNEFRDCVKIDMECLWHKVLNHYSDFKKEVAKYFVGTASVDDVDHAIEKEWVTDKVLMERYWANYDLELEKEGQEKNAT
jgi:hypothetical protein